MWNASVKREVTYPVLPITSASQKPAAWSLAR